MDAKRFSRGILILLVIVVLFGAVQTASAQEIIRKNIYYYQPPADGSGLLGAYGSEAIGLWGFYLGAYGDRAEQPLEWTDPEGSTHILIYDQMGTNILFGMGILSRMNLSVALPMGVARTFDEEYKGKIPQRQQNEDGEYETVLVEVDEKWEEFAIGDLRVQAKYIFRDRRYDQWGLAVLIEAGLPTGDKAQFVSDEQFTIAPRGIFDIGNTWWTYVLNVSYKYYPDPLEKGLFDIEGGNELIINTGVDFRFLRYFDFIMEFQTRTLLENFYSNENVDYGEALFALRSTFGARNPGRITLGAGFGALDGIGTPLYRLVFGIDLFVREAGLPR